MTKKGQGDPSEAGKRGYDAYTLNTLRRYVMALGEGFSLEVTIRTPGDDASQVSIPPASV